MSMNISIRFRVAVIGMLLVAFGVTGCEPKGANALKSPVSALPDLEVQSFPRADLSLNESQIFIWPKNVTSTQVARVLSDVSELEWLKDELFVKMQFKSALKAEFEAQEIDVTELAGQELQFTEKQADLARFNAQLAELQQQPSSDDVDSQIRLVNRKIIKTRLFLDAFAASLQRVTELGWLGKFTEWKLNETEILASQERANALLVPIDQTVFIFNSSPIHFNFTFDANRTLRVAVSNFDLSRMSDPDVAEVGVAKDFSTDAGTLGHPAYSLLGGVFSFELYTPAATYWFKMARSKYHAIDQRIHYKADVVRCSVEHGDGRPVVIYERDYVKCGVSTQGLARAVVGVPVLRRGAGSFTDRSGI